MINLLVVVAGLVVLGLSLVLGIVLPIGRLAPGRRDAPVPKAHVFKGVVGAAVGALILVAGISAPFVEVPAGNVGVVTNFGSAQAGTLEPGLHIVIPIVQHVAIIDTRVQPHQFQEIDAASSEYQTVKLTGVMNYHVDGQYASDLYQRVGTDFVIMWRQKASAVVFAEDTGPIRRDLESGLRRLQGCRYQVVLREVQTLAGHPDRLHAWTRLAKEIAEQYA